MPFGISDAQGLFNDQVAQANSGVGIVNREKDLGMTLGQSSLAKIVDDLLGQAEKAHAV